MEKSPNGPETLYTGNINDPEYLKEIGLYYAPIFHKGDWVSIKYESPCIYTSTSFYSSTGVVKDVWQGAKGMEYEVMVRDTTDRSGSTITSVWPKEGEVRPAFHCEVKKEQDFEYPLKSGTVVIVDDTKELALVVRAWFPEKRPGLEPTVEVGLLTGAHKTLYRDEVSCYDCSNHKFLPILPQP